MPDLNLTSGSGQPGSWRDLTRAQLDAAYNNSAAVSHSTQTVAGWEQRSAALRARLPQQLDLRYGPRERNRIDFLSAGESAPLLLFLHGGYWQTRAKEAFTFVANGPLNRGISVALAGYTLAPDSSLDEIVAESRAAVEFLANLAGRPHGRLLISGWSAGAQLAAMLLDHPAVSGALLISGVYDLEPVRHCYVNDKLGLDAASAARNSPMLRLSGRDAAACVAVGGAELPELRRQSSEYAEARAAAGVPGDFIQIPGCDHFSILDHLENPEGILCEKLSALAGAVPRS